MISSEITFRLNRRNADSIDSFGFTVIKAIYRLTSSRPEFEGKSQRPSARLGQTIIKPFPLFKLNLVDCKQWQSPLDHGFFRGRGGVNRRGSPVIRAYSVRASW